ncbi:MAG: tRNA epoxyqueuosine(34) reductase QueG [SAR202 cluster bacterium]|nr:tRNA epoxyqueuosine(34) reductase QueG [SAR202 cluster bacterium]
MSSIESLVKNYALELGFDLAGITSAQEFDRDGAVALERIRDGRMSGLPWYTEARVQRGMRPQELLPGARSIICLGLNYYPPDNLEESPQELTGRVARYARGRDYHALMKRRMRAYVTGLAQRLGMAVAARWYVDDGPMLDRAAAARAGLGWFGKNTNILTSSHGSWVLLGQVVADLELTPDAASRKSCGACTRCIPACPTGAIVAPYVVDNTRCISYLTIESRGPIPRELRPLMQDWVFGCDLCQEVCPVNRKAQPTGEPAFGRKDLALLDLINLLALTEEEFRQRFQGTPIMRAKRVGMQRNACVALGNSRSTDAVPVLSCALDSAEPLVRGHAAWALGRIGGTAAQAALEQALGQEQDAWVLEEIELALEERGTGAKSPQFPIAKGGQEEFLRAATSQVVFHTPGEG